MESIQQVRAGSARERMFRLFCSGALTAGPSSLTLMIAIFFACFLPSLQASSTFNEGELICLEADPGGGRASAISGQCCYLRVWFSLPEGLWGAGT